MKTLAIIPAGGSGTRMGGETAKQYLMLGGMTILERTLMAFQAASLVDAIYLVLPDEDVVRISQRIASFHNLSKLKRILPGGERRQDSVKKGVDLIDSDYDLVAVHDGVRPFVSPATINATIEKAMLVKAVTLGIPVTDTIKKVDGQRFICETVNRDQLWLTQTPQVFAVHLLKKAYESAYAERYYGTDDAALVERIGQKVLMIMGAQDNIKITTPLDLLWGEFILKMRQKENISSLPGDTCRRTS